MGFLDKVKSITRAITGGAADVTLEVGPVTMGVPFEVSIRAQAKSENVKYERVYLQIQGLEKVELSTADIMAGDLDPERITGVRRIRARGKTLELETEVAPGGELESNASQAWTVQGEIPRTAPPPFSGKYTRHVYRVRAGLDCYGNDPDSGWVDLEVRIF
jgi:hypothetical protein